MHPINCIPYLMRQKEVFDAVSVKNEAFLLNDDEL